MSKLKEYLRSSHIQIALASGSSILIIASFTGFILKKPMHPFLLTVPPLIEVAYEYFIKKNKESKICTTWYWVTAILVATTLILLLSWILS